jgi:hypothetical protein
MKKKTIVLYQLMWPVCKGGHGGKKRGGGRHVRRARGGWHVRGRGRRTRGRRVATCTGIGGLGECIRFGTLTRALPPSIWVIMQAFTFTLNDAYAALHKPALLGKATAFWDLLGAHAFGRFRPGLLIGRNNVLFG